MPQEKRRHTPFDAIEEQFHRERNTRAFYDTQGFIKPWLALRAIVQKNAFQKAIAELRRKYDIPPAGFKITTSLWTHPPQEWIHYHKENFLERRRIMTRIRSELVPICREYELPPKNFVDVLESHLFYNRRHIVFEPNSHNLIYVTDISTRRDSLGRELTDADIATHPVALLLSPYASERDLLDYIRKMYTTEVVPLQERYRKAESEIGKHRTRSASVREKYDFIFQHRDLGTKKIGELVWKRFQKIMRPGHINKIIALELARRK